MALRKNNTETSIVFSRS